MFLKPNAQCFAKSWIRVEDTFQSPYTSVVPTIDGQLSLGEWDDASSIEKAIELFTMKDFGRFESVEKHPFKLYFKNDLRFLYLAMVLENEEMDDHYSESVQDMKLDVFNVKFDNNNNGMLEVGEDQRSVFIVNGTPVYKDHHYISKEDKARGIEDKDNHSDGEGMIRFVQRKNHGSGNYIVELKIPLSSGDIEDINLKPGDRIKFNVFFIDKFTPSLSGTGFGALGPLEMDSAYEWSYLTLAKGRTDRSLTPAVGESNYLQEPLALSRLVNGGFEIEGSPPAGWFIDENAPGKVTTDRQLYRTGYASVRLTPNDNNKKFLTLFQPIDIESVRDKTVLIHGFICTQELAGSAGIILFTPEQGAGMFTVPSNTNEHFIEVVGSWHVPQDATLFSVGCFVMGTEGNAWFDDISVTPVLTSLIEE